MSEQRAPTSEEVIFIALVRVHRFLLEYLNDERPTKTDAWALVQAVRGAVAAAKQL
jgi:hypothetical protein